MLTRFKEKVQALLATEAELLHKAGLSPNQTSGLGILFAILAASFYLASSYNLVFLMIAPILFLLSGLFDALDGIMARLHGRPTIFGGYLDSLLDRYADGAVLVALIASDLCDPFWGSTALVGCLLVSYARARAEAAGTKMETVGLAERAERMLILSAASFAALLYFEALNWGVMVLAVLTNLTVIQRMLYFYNASKEK